MQNASRGKKNNIDEHSLRSNAEKPERVENKQGHALVCAKVLHEDLDVGRVNSAARVRTDGEVECAHSGTHTECDELRVLRRHLPRRAHNLVVERDGAAERVPEAGCERIDLPVWG